MASQWMWMSGSRHRPQSEAGQVAAHPMPAQRMAVQNSAAQRSTAQRCSGKADVRGVSVGGGELWYLLGGCGCQEVLSAAVQRHSSAASQDGWHGVLLAM
jgi:hypothetical protein